MGAHQQLRLILRQGQDHNIAMGSSRINDVLIPTHIVCCEIKSDDAMLVNAAFVEQDTIWTWLFMTCVLDAGQEMCFKFREKILKCFHEECVTLLLDACDAL